MTVLTPFARSVPIPGAGKWRCIAFVRYQAKTEQGTAIHAGLYDGTAGKSVATVDVAISQCAGSQYKSIDLGVHDLQPGLYFWFALANNPEAVDTVYVDRRCC